MLMPMASDGVHMPMASHGVPRALQVTNLCLDTYGYAYAYVCGLPQDSTGLPSCEPMVVLMPMSVASNVTHQALRAYSYDDSPGPPSYQPMLMPVPMPISAQCLPPGTLVPMPMPVSE